MAIEEDVGPITRELSRADPANDFEIDYDVQSTDLNAFQHSSQNVRLLGDGMGRNRPQGRVTALLGVLLRTRPRFQPAQWRLYAMWIGGA